MPRFKLFLTFTGKETLKLGPFQSIGLKVNVLMGDGKDLAFFEHGYWYLFAKSEDYPGRGFSRISLDTEPT